MSGQRYTDGVLVESWDDATRTYTDHTTDPPTTRPYTAEENDAADQRIADDARLDNHEARIAALEAAMWPAPLDPTDPADPSVPTWAELGGAWPNQGLLAEGGTVWRNVSGVPLTTPPSGFPGAADQWTHLFVAVVGPPNPDPETPAGYVGPWNKDTTYKVGDVCDKDGVYYRCKVAHGAEYQGTWAPPQASVWDVVGPV